MSYTSTKSLGVVKVDLQNACLSNLTRNHCSMRLTVQQDMTAALVLKPVLSAKLTNLCIYLAYDFG